MDSGFGKTTGGYLVVYKDGVRSKAVASGRGIFGNNYFVSGNDYNYCIKYLEYPKEDRGVTLGPGELIWWNDAD